MVEPLKLHRNASQILRSSHMLLEIRIWEYGFLRPLMAKEKLHKNTLAIGMTRAAKAKKPNRDWASFRSTFLLKRKTEIMGLIFWILCRGNLNSITVESMVIPKNSIEVEGKTVFRMPEGPQSVHKCWKTAAEILGKKGDLPGQQIKNHLDTVMWKTPLGMKFWQNPV